MIKQATCVPNGIGQRQTFGEVGPSRQGQGAVSGAAREDHQGGQTQAEASSFHSISAQMTFGSRSQLPSRDRNTTRATFGQSLSLSAFPRDAPV